MKKIVILIILLCSISIANESKPEFELEAPNIVGIHPAYIFPRVSHDFVLEIDYLREFSWIDLLSRISLTTNRRSERSKSKGITLELGARKSFYPFQNKLLRIGPYIQASMSNEYRSTKYYKYYTGIVLASAGLRIQIRRFVMDYDMGIGPRFSNAYPDVNLTLQPNFMLGVAF